MKQLHINKFILQYFLWKVGKNLVTQRGGLGSGNPSTLLNLPLACTSLLFPYFFSSVVGRKIVLSSVCKPWSTCWKLETSQAGESMQSFLIGFVSFYVALLYTTNRCHDAVRLFSNWSQMKRTKKSGTRAVSRVCHWCSLWHRLWSITEQTYGNKETISFA